MHVNLPQCQAHLTVAMDGDEAGHKAGFTLAARAYSQGFKVFMIQAHHGSDFNHFLFNFKDKKMKQDVQYNNENSSVNNTDNNNDTVSLKDHACLQAIPYEQALQQVGWGELKPINTALLPVEPFAPEQMPLTLRRYIYDVADSQQSPVNFVAVSALCGLAALIGNGVRIAPKQYSNDWKIVPNLWGVIIGQPSAKKTPAMQAALAPLYVFQNEWYQEWR
ncbi:Uncharacterised protein [Bartonella vinsonii]|uniref:Toprim domain-containing protein n=1 Tax=Bartonella vinsonii TaxID=33047 RepID=A0A3S5C0K0_BARVI|nr:Uncharacterised protein [Bartonella vinsonii]